MTTPTLPATQPLDLDAIRTRLRTVVDHGVRGVAHAVLLDAVALLGEVTKARAELQRLKAASP